jgi:ketose-bisphosphate aldolase
MPLVPIPALFQNALEQHYALGYFESWNLESLQGTIDAAEKTHSPVVIGFNGEFLTHSGRVTREQIAWYGALGRAAAESASVPCGFIFNECASDLHLRQAVTAGFNLVMPADPTVKYADYEQWTRALVDYAHPRGVAVEAEIGELPSGETGAISTAHSSLTDPDLAAQFATSTRVDLLSVSVGTVHILVRGAQPLDLDHLQKIREKTGVPLGLHGGSGIDEDSLKEAIRLGVVKVNYGTYLKQAYLAAMRKALDTTETNPHRLLGMGGAEDVLVTGRKAVRDSILERIETLGCCGRAS